MKYTPLKHLAPCMIASLIALAGSANGQGYEQIAGGQVVSDTVAAPGCTNCYVGDMPVADACGCTINGRSYGRPDLFYNFYTQGCANQGLDIEADSASVGVNLWVSVREFTSVGVEVNHHPAPPRVYGYGGQGNFADLEAGLDICTGGATQLST